MKELSTSKILFVDLESPRGHKDVACFFIKNVFPHFNAKYFLLERYLYEEIVREYGLRIDEYTYFFSSSAGEDKRMNRASVWLHFIKKLRFILKFMEKEQIEIVYFMSYDTVSFSLLYRQFLRYHVILLNHDNLARFVKNVFRRFILRRLHSFNHVIYSSAFEGFLKRYLKEKMRFDRVFFIDYQINDRENLNSKEYSPKSVYLLAPSASTDPSKILRLLHSAKSDRIRIKAKVVDDFYRKYSSTFKGNLFTGFLAKESFERLMEESDFILLLYPRDYRFRVSGLLFDAVSFEKPVITDNEFIYEGWIRESGIGIFVNNPEEIEDAVLGMDEGLYNQYIKNIRRFKGRFTSAGIGRTIARQVEEICEK